MQKLILVAFLVLTFSACTKSRRCTSDQAYNKAMALGKVQARIVTHLGPSDSQFATLIGQETAVLYELIAQKKLQEACDRADAFAKKYEMDLEAEQKDMVTMEELRKDGGKGAGTCSLADAAKKQMEVHGMIQAQVDAGKRDSEVFREFQKDTQSLGELMLTDPSKACALLEDLQKKYEKIS